MGQRKIIKEARKYLELSDNSNILAKCVGMNYNNA